MCFSVLNGNFLPESKVCIKAVLLFCILTSCLVILFGCADPKKKSEETDATATKKIKIGLSMDSLRVERWQKDRDIFTAEAEKLGAEVIVQSADGDERRQNEQAEYDYPRRRCSRCYPEG